MYYNKIQLVAQRPVFIKHKTGVSTAWTIAKHHRAFLAYLVLTVIHVVMEGDYEIDEKLLL